MSVCALRHPLRHLPCLVHGVDPAKTSGWARSYVALDGREHVHAGVARTAAEIRDAYRVSLRIAEGLGVPLVLLGEKVTGVFSNIGGRGPRRRAPSEAAIERQWGRWLMVADEELDSRGKPLPQKRRRRVHLSTWRAAVLGRSNLGTDDAKARAVRLALARWGLVLPHDAAEAACIAYWGSRSHEVAAVLPARALAKCAGGFR